MNFKKIFLIASGWNLAVCAFSFGQLFVDVEYGSATEGDSNENLSLFANSNGVRFDDEVQGMLAVGWSDGFSSGNTSLQDYLTEFNVLGSQNFNNVLGDGYLPAVSEFENSSENAEGKTGYVFVLAGVTNFSNASSASEFAILNDSSWATVPEGGGEENPDVWNVRSLGTVNGLVFGSQISGGGDGTGAEFRTQAIPEPSAYSTILGLLGLGYAILSRRRRSASRE